jgi:hypothetical protein
MVALLGSLPSAIIRRHTRLEGFWMTGAFAILVSVGSFSGRARAAEIGDAPQAEPDSGESTRWLPIPVEDLESAEGLEEENPGVRTTAILRGAVTRGQLRFRRIGFLGEGRGLRGELGFLLDEGRLKPGVRLVAANGRMELSGGRVSVSRAPPLLAEAMRITRSGRRVPAPRVGPIAAPPSLGASAGAIDGGAVAWRGALSAWAFAGIRRESREPLGAVGLAVSIGRTRIAAGLGAAADSARCASISVIRRDRGRSLAAEALGSREGRAFLAEVTARGESVLYSARWRYRSWMPRKVAAELSATTLGADSRARLTWRSWSGAAAADDGLLELEGASSRGVVPVRLRLGAAGLGRDGNRAQAREAYALIDATVARESRRSLAVHVLRRASASASSRASSTTVGTRLDVRAGRLGDHSLLIESTRLWSGATAWGVDLAPSGETTLRTRSKPGLWLTARGGFGARLWHLGYALERGEDSGGLRPWSGTMWLRLDR